MVTIILISVSVFVVWATWEILRSLERGEDIEEMRYNTAPVSLPPPPTTRKLEVVRDNSTK